MRKNLQGMLKWLVMLVLAAGLMCCGASADAAAFSDDPDAIEGAARSVLMLRIYDGEGKLISSGSGFVMFDNMTLVTNYHVIDDASIVIAEDDAGEEYILDKVLIMDGAKDIAILQFVEPTTMAPLTFSVDTVKRGSKVVAIGSPIGLKNTVSMGNVSAVYQEDGVNWIQFTAPVSHGSSGGAVFDDAGRVIGMSSAIYTEGQNLNLAISMADVIALYRQWDGHTRQAIQPQPDAVQDEDDLSAWVNFAPVMMPVLYGNSQEAMESYTSRVVAMACAVLDYIVAEPTPLEIGNGETYLMTQDEEALILCCPLMENEWGMQSAIMLYSFEEASYSILPADMTAEEAAMILSDDEYTFQSMSNEDVADALEVLLEAILEE